MLKIALIAAGGGVGAVLRFALSGLVQRFSGSGFPFGTLAVNAIGCFLIGLLGALFASPHLVREEYRFAVMVGVLGGFTTFSTFAWESLALANDGQFARALTNIVGANVAGLLLVWFGYRLGEHWWGV